MTDPIMKHSKLSFSTDIWYRKSTCEESYPSGWVVDVDIAYDEVISSYSRYTGTTELEVLKCIRDEFIPQIEEVIHEVERVELPKDDCIQLSLPI